MNTNYKIYISIGLLFSMTNQLLLSHTDLQNNNNMISMIDNNDEQESFLTEDECDEILHDIFENCFFNDNDTTRFSDIVGKMITILQVKINSLDQDSQKKCQQFITLLEKNKYVYEFGVWAKILVGSDLKKLLPKKTQDYIDQIPNFKKCKALMKRLQNK